MNERMPASMCFNSAASVTVQDPWVRGSFTFCAQSSMVHRQRLFTSVTHCALRKMYTPCDPPWPTLHGAFCHGAPCSFNQQAPRACSGIVVASRQVLPVTVYRNFRHREFLYMVTGDSQPRRCRAGPKVMGFPQSQANATEQF